MSKKIYLLSLFSLFLLLPHTSYADCTKEEIEHFKEIEDEYKVTYEFNKDTKDYTIKFHSSEPSKYDFGIYDANNLNCKDLNLEEYECDNVKPGEYKVGIFSLNESCDIPMKNITLKLPKYNDFSKDELCEGIEEFVLCQETYDKDITYEEFVSRTNTYKRTKRKEETKEKESEGKIKEYLENNSLQIIIALISSILVILIIILVTKSIKKSRRLE